MKTEEKPKGVVCENCCYWDHPEGWHDDGEEIQIGECRRAAPSPIYDPEEPERPDYLYPIVSTFMWCGDFREFWPERASA